MSDERTLVQDGDSDFRVSVLADISREMVRLYKSSSVAVRPGPGLTSPVPT
jgi:hypothetical protein